MSLDLASDLAGCLLVVSFHMLYRLLELITARREVLIFLPRPVSSQIHPTHRRVGGHSKEPVAQAKVQRVMADSPLVFTPLVPSITGPAEPTSQTDPSLPASSRPTMFPAVVS